jgi:hypothetical protein
LPATSFSARWFAGVKNTKNTAAEGLLRRCSGDFPAGSGAAEKRLAGGARRRGEKGVNGVRRGRRLIFIG